VEDDNLSPESVELAERLRQTVADPSPERQRRIMAGVRSRWPDNVPSRTAWWSMRRGLAAALVAAVALLAIGTATAMASSHALPNDPSYRLRGVIEQVRIGVSDPAGREQLRLDFARQHTGEALAIAHERPDLAAILVADSRRYLQDAGAGLDAVPQSSRAEFESELQQAQDENAQIVQQGEHQEPGGQSGGGSTNTRAAPPTQAQPSVNPVGDSQDPTGSQGGQTQAQPGDSQNLSDGAEASPVSPAQSQATT
jgi:hypothetical protein